MAARLLVTLDRTLCDGALSNARAAVRLDAERARSRREAAAAVEAATRPVRAVAR